MLDKPLQSKLGSKEGQTKSDGEDEAEAYFSALDYAYDIYKSSTPEKISELPVAKIIYKISWLKLIWLRIRHNKGNINV